MAETNAFYLFQLELTKKELKAKRMERLPLLHACDDLREDLLETGLQIKVRKETSFV